MAVYLARLWRPTGDAVFWKRSLRPFETEIQMDKSKGTNRSNSEVLKMFSIVSVEIYISFKLHATLEDFFLLVRKKNAKSRCDHTGNITYSRVASAGAKLWSQVLLSRHFLEHRFGHVSLKVTEKRARTRKCHLPSSWWLVELQPVKPKYERQNGFSLPPK